MLAGVGGAVVPLVLHLLSRARCKDVEWGAMMFLAGADARQRQSARLSQGLLLLVRMALVAVLAIALARPLLQSPGSSAGGGGDGRVTAALILDCSAAMGFDENGRTRFEMAQRAAKQVLGGLRPGDRITLIAPGALDESSGDSEPTSDQRSIAERIDRLKPGYGAADMRDALRTAGDLLERYEKQNREVYVISDRQAITWRNLDPAFCVEWLKRMRVKQHDPRFFVVPVGTSNADNVAVESVSLANAPAIRGQPAEVEVRLHNYGNTQRSELPLRLFVDSAKVLERKVNLGPNRIVTFRFGGDADENGKRITFAQAGSHVLAAEVTTSGYRADDRLESAIDVIEPVKVLIVSGDERPGAFRSEVDFLRWALAPHQAAQKAGADPCSVTVAPVEQWTGADLEKYQVAILANIERFSTSQVRAIERYVYDGGRVLIAPGSLTRIEEYNATLWRDGSGILPGELEEPTPADGSQATSLLGFDLTHPIFQFLRGKTDPIPTATVGRYFPTNARSSFARPLAWYASGWPFLIEGSAERGKVLLLTTSLDADWTTLPLSNFYLPFVQNIVRYLATDPVNRNLALGQPIRLGFSDFVPQRTVTLTAPDGAARGMEIVRFASQSEVRYGATLTPGRYQLRVDEPGHPAVDYFYVVRAPVEESDLTQLTPERWDFLAKNLHARRVDPSESSLRDVVASGRAGIELWAPGIALVLLLAVLEMSLARMGSVEKRG